MKTFCYSLQYEDGRFWKSCQHKYFPILLEDLGKKGFIHGP